MQRGGPSHRAENASRSVAKPAERLSVPNVLSPDQMTAVERLDEVARILATGILRIRQPPQGQGKSLKRNGEIPLDFTAPQRGHVSTKRRRGEK